MKNNIVLLCSIVSLVAYNGFAQAKEPRHSRSKQIEEVETPDDLADTDLTIVSYHVVETIKKSMGSSITSYDVTSLSMINSNDLGPNNTRIITPKYVRSKSIKKTTASTTATESPVPFKALSPKEQAAKEEEAKIEAAITEVVKEEIIKAETAKKEAAITAAKVEEAKIEEAKVEATLKAANLETAKAEAAKIEGPKTVAAKTEPAKSKAPANATPTKAAAKMVAIPASEPAKATPKKKENYVTIDIVNTYERVLEKGYKSVDMLTKVADRHFLNNELEAAAKWYNQLFELTKELDAVHYYRYAKSLEAVNELDKSNEMMAIFRVKNQQER